jgi:hypothetical protein
MFMDTIHLHLTPLLEHPSLFLCLFFVLRLPRLQLDDTYRVGGFFGTMSRLTIFSLKHSDTLEICTMPTKICLTTCQQMIDAHPTSQATACVILPLATGMTITTTLLALKTMRPGASRVIWPRIDQKTCLKAIHAAGLKPVVIENVLEGDEVCYSLPLPLPLSPACSHTHESQEVGENRVA